MKEFKTLGKWLLIILPMSVMVGTANAFFLWTLKLATEYRIAHPWLLYLLPLVGLLIVWGYTKFGKNSDKGNNLIMDEVHEPGGGVPFRMAPLVYFGTILTHLFGGSAGREGTAVQIGGSISALWSKVIKLEEKDSRILLISGVAAGFGAVFGTPLTGAIFALEVLAIGKIRYDAIIPALLASILADMSCSAWGLGHTHYSIIFEEQTTIFDAHVKVNLLLMLKVILASAAFGLAGFLFGELTHRIKDLSKRFIKNPYLIPLVGGGVVIAVTFLYGNYDYNGLGVYAYQEGGVSILNSFKEGGADAFSWLKKLVLTAITLGTGFKGGEVTPLFFVGSTLGNTLGWLMDAPIDLFAGLGFIAVFAAATNTPLACTIMGVELFGSENTLYFAVACFVAYYFSGHTGIYSSQKVGVPKLFDYIQDKERNLGEIRKDTLEERKKNREKKKN
ncbi:voltage-gated chloride channel family protein [Flammeovirgaceae bacterium SG7u.111]|nr:voltage-gated chloride channel family protein [Flammeovirgaceae bacterium SG7u.132]WPO38745.1 voltage-gated chloride channel family protein [Flammeovirgaceae bacterium SG7u.111]